MPRRLPNASSNGMQPSKILEAGQPEPSPIFRSKFFSANTSTIFGEQQVGGVSLPPRGFLVCPYPLCRCAPAAGLASDPPPLRFRVHSRRHLLRAKNRQYATWQNSGFWNCHKNSRSSCYRIGPAHLHNLGAPRYMVLAHRYPTRNRGSFRLLPRY